MNELHALRTEYAKASLDITTVSKDPFQQFEKWLTEAINAGVKEANAMCLATIGADGRPSQRIVLLKGVEENKFLFYTNYQSKKGTHLAANPICALNFFWPDLERQVRIEGVVERVSAEKSTEYFQSRPRGSQLGAWVSPQSAAIKDRQLLENRLKEIESKFEGVEKLPKPQQWGGYAVDPLMFEFWQGRPSRLHDRIEFVKVENDWAINRLAP
ncbi:MAG: pyridoxamine 5'-phosphate oxidase [Cytophagia bacterium]|nr:pyridoxamine 5'-phosphate oxidase [Cytophagia bacterium]NBW36941.1 pyridoxamine 5'-phosphate oxidase [Cytophagia bacterium]